MWVLTIVCTVKMTHFFIVFQIIKLKKHKENVLSFFSLQLSLSPLYSPLPPSQCRLIFWSTYLIAVHWLITAKTIWFDSDVLNITNKLFIYFQLPFFLDSSLFMVCAVKDFVIIPSSLIKRSSILFKLLSKLLIHNFVIGVFRDLPPTYTCTWQNLSLRLSLSSVS